MNVEFDKSFLKSIQNLKDPSILSKIEKTICDFEHATSVGSIKNTKKMVGYKTYYRTRIGDYRLGFELVNPYTIILIIVAHRKDIYKMFP